MFRNRTLKSITCVSQLDSEIHPRSPPNDRKKPRDGNTPRIFEIANEGNCDADADSLERKPPSKDKSSHIHRKWSKLKKYLSGHNGSQSSTDRDHEFGQSNISMRRLAREREMAKSTLEDSTRNVNNISSSRDKLTSNKSAECKRSTVEENAEIPSNTDSDLFECSSTENVKRWLNAHHQDSKTLTIPKTKKHIHHLRGRQVFEAEVFEPLYHHHSHVTHRKKHHVVHGSAGKTHYSNSNPVMSLPQFFELTNSENVEPFQSLQQPSSKESLSSLNPSLAQFMAELINSLEKLQRSNHSEKSETKLESHLPANVDVEKTAPKISRHLSDSSLHRFDESKRFNRITSKFSTSTPKEKGDPLNKQIHQSPVRSKTEIDEFPVGSFSITPSVVASINEETLKIQLDDKELTYNFQKDPSDLIKGMKDSCKSSIRTQEDIFSIYEFVVNIQSRIIRDLHCELNRNGLNGNAGSNVSKQN